MIFLQNLTFILANLILFTLCGWSVIAPFGRQIGFPTACAALSGMILLSCAALTIHVVLTMTYWKAAIAAGSILTSASLISIFILGYRDAVKGLPCIIVLAVVLAACATLTVTRTDLFFGGPALL